MVIKTVPVGKEMLLLYFRNCVTSYAQILLFSSSSLKCSEDVEWWTIKRENFVVIATLVQGRIWRVLIGEFWRFQSLAISISSGLIFSMWVMLFPLFAESWLTEGKLVVGSPVDFHFLLLVELTSTFFAIGRARVRLTIYYILLLIYFAFAFLLQIG